jgi:hypothetical protein
VRHSLLEPRQNPDHPVRPFHELFSVRLTDGARCLDKKFPISRNSMTSFRNCPDLVYPHITYDKPTDVIVHRLPLKYLTPRWSPQQIPDLNVTKIPPSRYGSHGELLDKFGDHLRILRLVEEPLHFPFNMCPAVRPTNRFLWWPLCSELR